MNIDDLLNTGFAVSLFKKLKKEQQESLNNLREELSSLIPENGDRGERGPAGPKGDQGIPGLQGIQGPRGEKGDKGDTGDIGPVGPIGPIGEKGEQGERGERGETGLQGIQGEQGPRGEKGERGEKGDKGDAGDRGDVGPEGPQGAQGDKGEAGPRGEKGERGPKGEKGDRGDEGPRGPIGPKGEDGQDGKSVDVEEVKTFIEGLVESAKTEIEKKHDEYVIISAGSTEESLVEFKKKLRDDVDRILETHKKIIDAKVAQSGWGSTSSGGGSTKILDNDDVVFQRAVDVDSDSILIFDPVAKKFKTEIITDALDRLGYQTGSGGGVGNIIGGTGIDVELTANSATIDLANTAVTPGTYGDATNVPQLTVDQQGRLTAITTVPSVGGGDSDIIQLADAVLFGTSATITYADYDITSVVSYVARDAVTNRVVSLDATITDTDITFEAFIDLSNFKITLSYLTPATVDVIDREFTITGTTLSVGFVPNNIGSIISWYVLDPVGNVVDLDAVIDSDSITVESNIPLTAHTLHVIYNSI